MRSMLLLALAGCAPSAEPHTEMLDAGWEMHAPPVQYGGGCGDAYVYAVNSANSRILKVQIDGIIERAQAAGSTHSESWALPAISSGVFVDAYTARRAGLGSDCYGYRTPDPGYTGQWQPISGTVRARVDPFSGDTSLPQGDSGISPALMDVLLEDVVFEKVAGQGPNRFTLARLVWQDIQVGYGYH